MTGGIGYFDHTAAGRLDWHRNESTLREEGYSTVLIANEAINLIKNKDESRPLFLYVAFNAPHTPIEAPLQNIEKFSYMEDENDRVYAANVNALDNEIGRIIKAIEAEGLLEETIILFFSDNGPLFDMSPVFKVMAPDLVDAEGSTGGLSGSKGSAMEGGIRVPAVMWWKGIIENEKSDQFFFVQDVLPTLLTAANIKTSEADKFDGEDKWSNLLSGQIVPPKNAFVGARIMFDERALFNDQWKLHSAKSVLFPVPASYQLFNIIEDPFEQNDLAEEEPEIFKAMKKTITSYVERDVVGNMNPAHGYLHGDNEQGGVEIGSPWLDGGYELNNPPSAVTSFFIFLWILVQAFKYQLAAAFLFIVLIIYAFKKLRQK